jgi:hypothetical protein
MQLRVSLNNLSRTVEHSYHASLASQDIASKVKCRQSLYIHSEIHFIFATIKLYVCRHIRGTFTTGLHVHRHLLATFNTVNL